MLKLVPFNPQWVTALGDSGAPLLDIHAYYRRPHRRKRDDGMFEAVRDALGFIRWDVVGPLPMGGNHRKWIERGFVYLTLGSFDDLVAVSKPDIAARGVTPLHDWQQYSQDPVTRGPFSSVGYRELVAHEHAVQREALIRDIREYGPERATLLRQGDDPGYAIPQAFLASLVPATPEPAKRKRGRPRKPKPEPPSATEETTPTTPVEVPV